MLAASTTAQDAAGNVPRSNDFVARIDLSGPIGPAAAEYVDDSLRRATRDGATAIVLQLDTPGGLSDSMREIIASILASPRPVIGYVAPSGARAASAGTYILYACPVAAMAPATHVGAATPVSLDGSGSLPSMNPPATPGSTTPPPSSDAESTKVLNDAVASIRSLAQLNGRNADWAAKAVQGAATLTADEAVQLHVADLIAPDVATLLLRLQGRHVHVGGQDLTLHLAGLSVRDYAPNWRTHLLALVTHPTIAYLLLLAGMYGLVLEAFHPGVFVPGVAGAICLLVGLYALQLLPVNYAGLALMLLGIGLVLAEALMPSVGAIGIGGVIAFVIGSIMLFDTGVPGYSVNLGVIAGMALGAVAVLAVLLRLVARSRRTRTFNGDAQMLLATGELTQPTDAHGDGWARISGEQWRVHSETALPAGTRVRVVGREGLLLRVTRA
ncbi:nodulation protein NfeD [Dyella telluris]|uniref:Nodulation protein NfeD n=2 Tax=Dyella telluris TaxID=2763498 RepID=A0A7G8QA44_9GAMM|nr:nodulation protein NfeD [Dyella telluris]